MLKYLYRLFRGNSVASITGGLSKMSQDLELHAAAMENKADALIEKANCTEEKAAAKISKVKASADTKVSKIKSQRSSALSEKTKADNIASNINKLFEVES